MKYPTLRLFDGYPHTAGQFFETVQFLQQKLADAKYLVTVDGYFGRQTEAAVEDFQDQRGLQVDGIVGPQTWAALLGEAAGDSLFDTLYVQNNPHMYAQLRRATEWRNTVEAAAGHAGVDVSVILAIGSRESAWGLALIPEGPEGTGDFFPRKATKPWRRDALPADGGGFGRGLMQIDYDAHEFAREGDWQDPEKNIMYGADVLFRNIVHFRRKCMDNWLAMSVAAYNCGPGNVMRAHNLGRDVDYYTSHRDYSRDVFSRAGWFQRYGWTED